MHFSLDEKVKIRDQAYRTLNTMLEPQMVAV